MRYQETRSLKNLIQTALGGHPKKDKFLHALFMQAWYQILPHTKDQLIRTYLKGTHLYLQPCSPLLKHQLSLQKTTLLPQLKSAIQNLGGDPSLLHDLCFI